MAKILKRPKPLKRKNRPRKAPKRPQGGGSYGPNGKPLKRPKKLRKKNRPK